MGDFRISNILRIAVVRLRVSDLGRSLGFYRELIGFREIGRSGPATGLSATGSTPADIVLEERPGIRPKPARTTGLYHMAIRVERRSMLARLLKRLLADKYPIRGAADHGVSEALYLADPDGNGVELYWDKPEELWPRHDGQVQMVTDPLDIEGLLGLTAEETGEWSLDPSTSVGHLHVQVPSLGQGETFYHGLLGLDITQRSYPGALFLSAGGYHHHIGLNTWGVAGAPPQPADTSGIVSFAIMLADQNQLENLRSHVLKSSTKAAIIPALSTAGPIEAVDPSGICVVIVAPGTEFAASGRDDHLAFLG